ncbi:MAG: alpha-ketoglutarate-dependent dioxygenase AlkB [Bacteroidota bacterium]
MAPAFQHLDLPDADISFSPDFFPAPEADRHLSDLIAETPWRQDKIRLFGKEHLVPRLVAWHGDPAAVYTYSNIRMAPEPWSPTLQAIRQACEAAAQTHFNSVLLNRYRHGQDSMGWHADDEPELGENPIIASVSFGQARPFHLRHRDDKSLKHKLLLTHGSLLIMAGSTQHHWQHHIPKSRRPMEERLNLTFRWIFAKKARR